MGAIDSLTPFPRGSRNHGPIRSDLGHLLAGRLDPRSFISGWRKVADPVEVRTTSLVPDGVKVGRALCTDPAAFTDPVAVAGIWRDAAYGMQRRVWREIRRTHNLRLNAGRDQFQRIATFGDIGTSLNGLSATGTATVPTATTWTGAAASFPTAATGAGNTGLQGKLAFVANAVGASAFTNPVVGVIVSNTATVLTVDQWLAVPITGAVGTTPAAASAAFILPGAAPMWWVALSTSAAAAAATDVTRTADGLWGDGTGGGVATEQTLNGLARAYVGNGGGTAPTFPGAAQETFNHTWTYTGAGSVTIPKVVLFDSLAAAGTLAFLETLLNASATVAANGDTIQLAGWAITF